MFIRIIGFAHVPAIFRLDFEPVLTVWYFFGDNFIRPLLTIFQLFCDGQFYLGETSNAKGKKNASNGQALLHKFATCIPSYMSANWIDDFGTGRH